MRTTARSTRRTTPSVGKENLANRGPASQRESVPTPSSKKARHRLSTAELARLEDVFKQDTHPSRQQKKELAAELGMDYKTVTIWFQNKRQTSKRGQPHTGPGDRSDKDKDKDKDRNPSGPRADSCLRAVSSPSHNATLDASRNKAVGDGLNAIAAKAIKPLLDTLNALTPKPRGHAESTEINGEALNVKDIDSHRPQTSSENPAEPNRHDQVAEQEQAKGKSVRWKRIRTLEWACERQAKRRKLTREAYVRLGSEEVAGHGDPNGAQMDSALSLLSLASSAKAGPPKDVMRGVSLLLGFKHSWRRKQ